MHIIHKWLYALKLKSWPKILVPFVLGHALGAANSPSFSWAAFGLSSAAVVCGVAFIVLLNDWGDRRVDRIKREMFPDGCSPKTIPDGILTASALLRGGVIAGAVAFALVVGAGFWLERGQAAWWLAAVCCLTFVAYTFPPLRLNYRGGGELLEMLGVGLFLPLFMAYLQSGKLLPDFLLTALMPYTLLSLGSALASGLSDEESDRAGGKHTFVTRYGNPATRKVIERLVVVALAALIWLNGVENALPWRWAWGLVAWAAWCWWKMRCVSPQAATNQFRQQAVYKQYLHLAIWGLGCGMASALVL